MLASWFSQHASLSLSAILVSLSGLILATKQTNSCPHFVRHTSQPQKAELTVSPRPHELVQHRSHLSLGRHVFCVWLTSGVWVTLRQQQSSHMQPRQLQASAAAALLPPTFPTGRKKPESRWFRELVVCNVNLSAVYWLLHHFSR